MKKIVTIVGARPQFVKAAVLSREMKKHSALQEVLVHTGQHFDANMSDVFFEEMEIPKPDYNLAINSLSHGAMTGRMLEEIETVLKKEEPDAVVVYGDTNSTLAGALAAKKMHIPVAHIEAGLRSYNERMPEEVNRVLTDRISSWLFCPTHTAVINLHKEGWSASDERIINCGDIMYDAVLHYSQKALATSTILEATGVQEGEFVLATIHRQENTQDEETLKEILRGLELIHEKQAIVWPCHPRTRKTIANMGLSTQVKFIDPVGYFDMLKLLNSSSLVITDSGGLQKEAYFFKKYCITVREQTEWTELVDAGINSLVAADATAIKEAFDRLSKKNEAFPANMYGDGKTGELIVQTLLESAK